MRIGMQQTAFGDIGLRECFVRAGRAGAEGLGLCYRTPDEALALGDAGHVREVRSLCERFGLPVLGLHLDVLCARPCLIGSPLMVERFSELVREAIAASVELGTPDVIVPFLGCNRIELPKEFDVAAAAMLDLAAAAEERGVTLAVESSLPLGQLEELLAGCGSDFVKACVDTGELTACRHDPGSMIRGLGSSAIAGVHLRDVQVASGLPPEFNVRLGRGNVNFRGVAAALQDVGYDGWVVLETPPGDERGAILAANVEYVRLLLGLPGSARPGGAGTALSAPSAAP